MRIYRGRLRLFFLFPILYAIHGQGVEQIVCIDFRISSSSRYVLWRYSLFIVAIGIASAAHSARGTDLLTKHGLTMLNYGYFYVSVCCLPNDED